MSESVRQASCLSFRDFIKKKIFFFFFFPPLEDLTFCFTRVGAAEENNKRIGIFLGYYESQGFFWKYNFKVFRSIIPHLSGCSY